MRPTEIEGWAHRVMDRVEAGQPNEDSRVELKRDWVEPASMARRLAGHANAARTDPILWLIGVDEKARLIAGAAARELANWYPALTACFQEVAPSVVDVIVHRGDKTVVALLFETDRPPYVIRNPAFGSAGVAMEYEVPWREGTRLRSARRQDLFRVLLPQAALPTCELLRVATRGVQSRGVSVVSQCLLLLYFVPPAGGSASLPYHRCCCRIRTPGRDWVLLESLRFDDDFGDNTRPSYQPRRSPAIVASERELTIGGPGSAILTGEFLLTRSDGNANFATTLELSAPIEVDLTLGVAGSDVPLRTSAILDLCAQAGPGEGSRWLPRQPPQGG